MIKNKKPTIVEYRIFRRDKRKKGNSNIHNIYLSIAGVDKNGNEVHDGHTPYIFTMGRWEHKHGVALSSDEQANYDEAYKALSGIAEAMNKRLEEQKV